MINIWGDKYLFGGIDMMNQTVNYDLIRYVIIISSSTRGRALLLHVLSITFRNKTTFILIEAQIQYIINSLSALLRSICGSGL